MTGERSCDASAAGVFIVGLVAGTLCIIASKALFEGYAHGVTGELEPFQPPVFETFIMFFGMVFALPLYFGLELYKRIRAQGDPVAQAKLAAEPKITLQMVLSLGILCRGLRRLGGWRCMLVAAAVLVGVVPRREQRKALLL